MTVFGFQNDAKMKVLRMGMPRDGIKLALLEVAAQYSVLALERAHERPIFGSPGFRGYSKGLLEWVSLIGRGN